MYHLEYMRLIVLQIVLTRMCFIVIMVMRTRDVADFCQDPTGERMHRHLPRPERRASARKKIPNLKI